VRRSPVVPNLLYDSERPPVGGLITSVCGFETMTGQVCCEEFDSCPKSGPKLFPSHAGSPTVPLCGLDSMTDRLLCEEVAGCQPNLAQTFCPSPVGGLITSVVFIRDRPGEILWSRQPSQIRPRIPSVTCGRPNRPSVWSRLHDGSGVV
jgi:hypothetical protein